MSSFESVCHNLLVLDCSDWTFFSGTLKFLRLWALAFLFHHFIIFSLLLTAADSDI